MVLYHLYKKYPAYGLLQVASIMTILTNWAAFLAMLVLLDRLTESGLAFGSLWAVSGLIPLILGYFSGVWIDRLNVKKLIVVTEITAAIGFGFFLVMFSTPGDWQWVVFLVARLFILLSGNINGTCVQTVIPDIIEKEDLVKANSFSFSLNNVLRLTGASLGGVLLAVSSLEFVFLLNVITCLVAALLSYQATKYFETPEKTVARKNYLLEFKEGITQINVNKWVLSVVVAAIFSGIIIGNFNLMLQQFTAEVYQEEDYILSYLYVAHGVVAFIVAYTLAKRNFLFKNRVYYGLNYMLFGLIWMCFGLTSNYIQGMIVLILFGIVGAFNGPYERTTMQHEVPDHMRGRIFATWQTTYSLSIQLGAFLSGVIITVFGLRWVPIITGMMEILLGVFVVVLSIKVGKKIHYHQAS
ncbi:MFS transporter [Piscibacillus sp. B03]|uniref:MFS transporter n=1 Tax=Piscibacillus sp. B03 TaxID=3457430 RepID=UPI003FCD4C07